MHAYVLMHFNAFHELALSQLDLFFFKLGPKVHLYFSI